MVNVLILFLEFNQEKAENALTAIKDIIEGCTKTCFTLVTINNRESDSPWKLEAAKPFIHYTVGGDNICHEFSGWDKGWLESRHNIQKSFDVIVLANDALLNSKPLHQCQSIDDQLFDYLSRSRTVVGWVDNYSRVSRQSMDLIFHPMKIFGYSVRSWICTTFILFSRPVFEAVLPLASFSDLDKVYHKSFEDGMFKSDCGLSPAYQHILLLHQSHIWKKKYILSSETFELFRLKTRGIINESILGRRIFLTGAMVLDISILYLYHSLQLRTKHRPLLTFRMRLLALMKCFENHLGMWSLKYPLLSIFSFVKNRVEITKSAKDYYWAQLKKTLTAEKK